MMKIYVTPQLKIGYLQVVDVLKVSSGDGWANDPFTQREGNDPFSQG